MIAYALTIGSLLLPMGRLSDIVGRKRLYLVGFAIFLVAALLCAVGGSIVTLIGSRVLMGLGASMTQATSTAILLSSFGEKRARQGTGPPDQRRGRRRGWRATHRRFRRGAVRMARSIPADGGPHRGRHRRRTGRPRPAEDRRCDIGWKRFDLVGAITSTAVLVVFLLAMSNGAELGWRSAPIAAGFAAVIGLAAFFTYWEMRARSPMLDVTLFRHPVFTIGVAASAISFMSIASVRFLMPFYLQTVLGYSPGAVGLVLVPAAFSMIVVGPLGGRLSDRYGWTPFNAGGLLFSATGLFILSRATETSPIGLIVLGTVTQSVGMGTFNPPNNSSILSVVDRSSYGAMSGFLNLVRNAANITGIAVATTIVVTVMGTQGFEPSLAAVSEPGAQGVLGAFTSGMKTAYLSMTGLAFAGALLSMLKARRTA